MLSDSPVDTLETVVPQAMEALISSSKLGIVLKTYNS